MFNLTLFPVHPRRILGERGLPFGLIVVWHECINCVVLTSDTKWAAYQTVQHAGEAHEVAVGEGCDQCYHIGLDILRHKASDAFVEDFKNEKELDDGESLVTRVQDLYRSRKGGRGPPPPKKPCRFKRPEQVRSRHSLFIFVWWWWVVGGRCIFPLPV